MLDSLSRLLTKVHELLAATTHLNMKWYILFNPVLLLFSENLTKQIFKEITFYLSIQHTLCISALRVKVSKTNI